jgi:hypothetical protein
MKSSHSHPQTYLLYWKPEEEETRWQPIPCTERALKLVLKQKAMFTTWCRFSEPYIGNGQPEPNRKGNFPSDTDCKEHPEKALDDMRRQCLVLLPELYGVDPYAIRYFASGGKGFHCEIPAELFGAQDGDPHLPLIYKMIACDWATRFNLPTMDLSLYAMQLGKMWRLQNVKRRNGHYKVPLTLEEFRDLSITELMDLTKSPREIEPVEVDLVPSEDLVRLYQEAKDAVYSDLERVADATPMSEEERERLAHGIPPCVKHILSAMPAKTDRMNFNKLVMILAEYFHLAGCDDVTAWTHVERFVDHYPHSETYATPGDRTRHWRTMWKYLDSNPKYTFNCSYVLGLKLPGSAFECGHCPKLDDAATDERPQPCLADACLDDGTFVSLQFPDRNPIVYPWLNQQSIDNVNGWRGVGKTSFAIGCLNAITKGLPFGPWETSPVNCLYFDAEMVPQDVQKRLADLGTSGRITKLFVFSDAYATSLGLKKASLLDPKWRADMKQLLLKHDVRLWVADNISSLSPGIDENSKELWDPINQFLIELRFAGISTMLLHHEGKTGVQRGTSGREDNIDISISLKQPKDYVPEDGARFIVKFTKSRIPTSDLHLIRDTEFQLMQTQGNCLQWTHRDVKAQKKNQILRLSDDGMTVTEIAEELNVDKSYVSKVRKSAMKDGLLGGNGKLTQTGFNKLAEVEI